MEQVTDGQRQVVREALSMHLVNRMPVSTCAAPARAEAPLSLEENETFDAVVDAIASTIPDADVAELGVFKGCKEAGDVFGPQMEQYLFGCLSHPEKAPLAAAIYADPSGVADTHSKVMGLFRQLPDGKWGCLLFVWDSDHMSGSERDDDLGQGFVAGRRPDIGRSFHLGIIFHGDPRQPGEYRVARSYEPTLSESVSDAVSGGP